MNQPAFEQLVRARTALILDEPFFGSLALRLTLKEDTTVKTLAVDGKRIYYNPDFVLSLSAALTKSGMAHEVMHCVFEHISRRGDRNPRKWNHAGDYAINLMLKGCGFEIGKNWLLNTAYAGMTADQIYNLLPEGEGSDPGDPDGPLDSIMDAEPDEVQAQDWQIATVQAVQSAKAMGKLSAGLARFVDEMTTPKVDWRAVLRRFVTETSKDDYSWMRPNRRFASQGIFLPGLWGESMGEIVVGIDTSGSIDQATLNAFASEVKAIVQSARPSKTTVIYCDAKVNHVDVFDPNDELHFEMHGGGGTDFCPPFALLEAQGTTPVCFVYLTDGYGPFPADPGYPVLWCMTTDVVAPIGETVHIEI